MRTKRTKIAKKLVTLAGIACLGISALCCPAATITANAVTVTSEDPRADVFEWRYRTMGTSLFRRLYNVTTSEWVGNWEYVGEIE